ncbi:MAG: thrombospondin type 3 repeat-containing protein [Proteobacteria bacterium]|nr:thrombospondin type 3 repeat-containing protein [Pseudomonadota bacterium]
MKKLAMMAAILGTVSTLAIADAQMSPAAARDRFSFSFSVGDVDVAYRNGYYDRSGRFHYWASPREQREWRARYAARYRDMDWDGVPDRYDRDRDGDGIPNYYDNRPNRPGSGYGYRPSRRDWDGDGVPNRYDDFPRNPRRH